MYIAENAHIEALARQVNKSLMLRGAASGCAAHDWKLPQRQWAYKHRINAEIEGEPSYEVFEGDFEDIQSWRGFRPSKVNLVRDKVQGFAVKNPHAKRVHEKITLEQFVHLGIEFLAMPDHHLKEGSIDDLAEQYGVKTGKWMFFFNQSLKADQAWQNLIKCLVNGGIENVVHASINVYDPRNSNPHKGHGNGGQVIKIATDDYADEVQTKVIGRQMLEIIGGFGGGSAKYKPDIYSILKIMAGNPYQIKPTIYSLNSRVSGMSRIPIRNRAFPDIGLRPQWMLLKS